MPVFGSAKKTADSLGYDKVQTVIGEGTEIKGSFQAKGVVRIDGTLEGNVHHDGDLIVGPKGRIIAEVHSKALAVAGEVRGNVNVQEKLELLPGAVLYGDIRCGHLIVHEGATFHGRSLMGQEAATEKAAAARLEKPVQPEKSAEPEPLPLQEKPAQQETPAQPDKPARQEKAPKNQK